MSNAGKTTWAKRLESDYGYVRYSVDDMIEEKLSPILQEKGYSGIADVAKWMGMPFEKQYPTNSGIYMDQEIASMHEVLEIIEEAHPSDNIVIDTTGSVIYTGDGILDRLQAKSTIVYLETPAEVKREMFVSFMKEPKPIIWGDVFSPRSKEESMEAIKRLYPVLLDSRTREYSRYAHTTIPFDKHMNHLFTSADFIKYAQGTPL